MFGEIISMVLILPFAAGQVQSAEASTDSVQWRVTELTFQAEKHYENPFDTDEVHFSAVFLGPNNRKLEVPGFWDGGRTWRIRFTPTAPGEWHYATVCSNHEDAGLHDVTGQLVAKTAAGHALWTHGGFLRVSQDDHYLTYTDGTPFFWLADTWWACPSFRTPFDNFRKLVDTRVSQGFSVFQAHGFRSFRRPGVPDDNLWSMAMADQADNAFEAVQNASEESLRYWRETDKYYAYADARGMLGIVGFWTHNSYDRYDHSNHKRLWRYFVARYGAYPITFLITQEYNAREAHVQKYIDLGAFIEECDPYKRAMSAHAWARSRDKRQAWDSPWHDFIMLQAGHFRYEQPEYYHDIYFREAPQPVLESETNYEGFERPNFKANAECIRRCAYTAVQSGCFGFSYGAQGLYHSVLTRDVPGPTKKWGPVLTWDEGLSQPGGHQLQFLRQCYESVEWWQLEPQPGAIRDHSDILVKSQSDKVFVVWFPAGVTVAEDARLFGARYDGATYTGEWFDPRTGTRTVLKPIRVQARGLILPNRPSEQDWVLILRHRSGGKPDSAYTTSSSP